VWYQRDGEHPTVHLIPTAAWSRRPVIRVLQDVFHEKTDVVDALAPAPVGTRWTARLRLQYKDFLRARQRSGGELAASADPGASSAVAVTTLGPGRSGNRAAAGGAAVPGGLVGPAPPPGTAGAGSVAAVRAADVCRPAARATPGGATAAGAFVGPPPPTVPAAADTAGSATAPALAATPSLPRQRTAIKREMLSPTAAAEEIMATLSKLLRDDEVGRVAGGAPVSAPGTPG
jgi:hypothetical protein